MWWIGERERAGGRGLAKKKPEVMTDELYKLQVE
jgi:hypothetical protein